MPDRAKKKQLKRLKREEKRARHQKIANLSPFKKVEMFSELSACYINPDWKDRGLATGFVVRQMRDGSMAMTSFLIDSWCAGLKSIWARFDLYSDQVADTVKRVGENMHTTLVRITPEDARKLLAAGIRFAKQNGFRLPDDLQKCLSFIGPLGNLEDADLAGFGFEGDPNKLFWCAPLDDLKKRLVGCSVEEFLAKPNVEHAAEIRDTDFEDFDDDEDDRYNRLMDRFEDMVDVAATEIEVWLTQRGETPSAKLAAGFAMMLGGTLLRFARGTDDKVMIDAVNDLVVSFLDGDISQVTNPSKDIELSLLQVKDWLGSFASADEAFNYLTDKLDSAPT